MNYIYSRSFLMLHYETYMNRPIRTLKIIVLCLLVLFLLDILTVESHQDAKGSFGDRLPTCVESTVTFAVDSHANEPFRMFFFVQYFPGFVNAEALPQLIIFFNNDNRAPPLSSYTIS
jgi:hypothetical protein